MNALKPELERYQRVHETTIEPEDDPENPIVTTSTSWTNSIRGTTTDSAPSFHRIATVDDEQDDDHHSSSFDLDDDDAELGRYKFDFTEGTVERVRTQLSAGSTLEERLEQGTLNLTSLWDIFCKARVEARRKRIERMLSVNSDWERFTLAFLSYCDLTDRGMPCFIVVLVGWIALAQTFFSHPWKMSLWGVLIFFIRVMWRPTYWYFWGRQVAKRRKRTLEKYAESNSVAMTMVTPPDFAVRKETEPTTWTTSNDNTPKDSVYRSTQSNSSSEDEEEAKFGPV